MKLKNKKKLINRLKKRIFSPQFFIEKGSCQKIINFYQTPDHIYQEWPQVIIAVSRKEKHSNFFNLIIKYYWRKGKFLFSFSHSRKRSSHSSAKKSIHKRKSATKSGFDFYYYFFIKKSDKRSKKKETKSTECLQHSCP